MADTIADVLRELGGLAADAENARESRRAMHEKLDEAVRAQGLISSKVDVVHEIAEQARANAKGALEVQHRFEREFHEVHRPAIAAAAAAAEAAVAFKAEAQPTVAFMKTVQNIVLAGVGALGLTLIGVISMILWAREQFGTVLRWVLGL